MKHHDPRFPIATTDTAPAASRALLAAAKAKFGFIPNLLAVLAGAPAALEAYLDLAGVYEKSSLSPTERQVVLLVVNFENDCRYCMAAHSAIAGMQKVDAAVVDAIRGGTPLPEPRLEALRTFVVEIVRTRGRPSAEALDEFIESGYTTQSVLEIVVGVGFKTISNYVNHIARTPLDAAFSAHEWSPPHRRESTDGAAAKRT